MNTSTSTSITKEARRLMLLIQRECRTRKTDVVGLGDCEAIGKATLFDNKGLKQAQIECKTNGWLSVVQGKHGGRYSLTGVWHD